MTRGADPGRPCKDPGCDVKIVWAKRAGTDRWLPLEVADQEPFSVAAVGCVVVVGNVAWKPADLMEHFRVRSEGKATEDHLRDLAAGYPWRRIHLHEPADQYATTSNGAA